MQDINYVDGSVEIILESDEHIDDHNDLTLQVISSTRDFPITMTYFPSLLFSKFPNLTQISIADASIQNIDQIFENCEKLEEIFLDWNNVNALPSDSFKKCENLLHLSLDQNNITEVASDAFVGLRKLKSLSLSYNPIVNLQSNTFNDLIELQTLELLGTRLVEIQAGLFGSLRGLEWLGLGFNRLHKIETGTFKELPSLRRLFLRFNCPSIEFESLAFESLNNLEDLDLEGNNIKELNADAFGTLANLKWINMKGNDAENIEQQFATKFPRLLEVYKPNGTAQYDVYYNSVIEGCESTASTTAPLISISTIAILIFSLVN